MSACVWRGWSIFRPECVRVSANVAKINGQNINHLEKGLISWPNLFTKCILTIQFYY